MNFKRYANIYGDQIHSFLLKNQYYLAAKLALKNRIIKYVVKVIKPLFSLHYFLHTHQVVIALRFCTLVVLMGS